MDKLQSSFYRWLGVIILFPVMIREWIDVLTDIGSFKGNAKLIESIMAYNPSAIVQTTFDRTLHAPWLAYVGSAGFILMHLVLGVLLLIGMVQIIRYRHADHALFRTKLRITMAGLCLDIACYVLLFCVIAMDYFMSQLHGFDYNLQILAIIVPAAIVLFYLGMMD